MTINNTSTSLNLKRALGTLAAAITATLAAGGTAHAQLASTPGYYIGGNVGQSHLKDDSPLGTDTDRSDTGYKFYGGYQFNPNFALELGYTGLGKFEAPSGDVKARGLYLDAVGLVPLAPQWSALGRIGVVDTEAKISGSGPRHGPEGRCRSAVRLQPQYRPARRVGALPRGPGQRAQQCGPVLAGRGFQVLIPAWPRGRQAGRRSGATCSRQHLA